MNIKHNITYVPLKSDLRPATAEEILKYKDANKHGRKRAPEAASTGEVSASGTTMEPEGTTGTSKGGEPRKSKGVSVPLSDGTGKSEHGRANRSRDDKKKESRKDSSRDDARKAKETADEKDAAEDEADKREYTALKNKMIARRIAREIQAAHDTLASLRAEQDDVSGKIEIVAKTLTGNNRERKANTHEPEIATGKSRATRPAIGATVDESGTPSVTNVTQRIDKVDKARSTVTGDIERADASHVPNKGPRKCG